MGGEVSKADTSLYAWGGTPVSCKQEKGMAGSGKAITGPIPSVRGGVSADEGVARDAWGGGAGKKRVRGREGNTASTREKVLHPSPDPQDGSAKKQARGREAPRPLTKKKQREEKPRKDLCRRLTDNKRKEGLPTLGYDYKSEKCHRQNGNAPGGEKETTKFFKKS